MKKFIFLLALFMPFLMFAQKARIDFETTSHNFGTISENGGKATFEFFFKNSGSAPLLLTNVKAGCGCTTPEWNRQPVGPGERGSIKVSFDPRNRPGSFVKSITVNSNAENALTTLVIRGNVSRKPLSPYEAYKFPAGPIRMKSNALNFGMMKNSQEKQNRIEVINTSAQTVEIKPTSSSPAISVSADPMILKKNQKGFIVVKYDASRQNDWGFLTDSIHMKINDRDAGIIRVSAHINEDFSAYAGNFEKAPVAHFSEQEIQLGELEKNTTRTHDFYIQNTGKSDLIIRKVNTSDETVSVHLAKNVIRPGKKVKATVSLKTSDHPKIIKIIRFIVNDPQNPVVTCKVTGSLKG